MVFCFFFFFLCPGDPRDLNVLTPSFPTQRASDLRKWRRRAAPELPTLPSGGPADGRRLWAPRSSSASPRVVAGGGKCQFLLARALAGRRLVGHQPAGLPAPEQRAHADESRLVDDAGVVGQRPRERESPGADGGR